MEPYQEILPNFTQNCLFYKKLLRNVNIWNRINSDITLALAKNRARTEIRHAENPFKQHIASLVKLLPSVSSRGELFSLALGGWS